MELSGMIRPSYRNCLKLEMQMSQWFGSVSRVCVIVRVVIGLRIP